MCCGNMSAAQRLFTAEGQPSPPHVHGRAAAVGSADMAQERVGRGTPGNIRRDQAKENTINFSMNFNGLARGSHMFASAGAPTPERLCE